VGKDQCILTEIMDMTLALQLLRRSTW
jgi:hypothetical protein